MFQRHTEKIPLKRALIYLAGSVMAVFIPLGIVLFYYQHFNELRKQDPQYHITAIMQNANGHEMLMTSYLAELVKLSVNKPTNLFAFDAKEGEHRLLQSPLIKEAKIEKVKPGTLLIHYKPAIPIAYVMDVANAAMDSEGDIIPFKPFFTPKKLPELYLGLSEPMPWGKKPPENYVELAKRLLKELQPYETPYFRLRRLDVSKAFSSGYGERQIVVIFEEIYALKKSDKMTLVAKPRILRLSHQEIKTQMKHYATLAKYRRKHSQTNAAIFDLRIPNLAFVEATTWRL